MSINSSKAAAQLTAQISECCSWCRVPVLLLPTLTSSLERRRTLILLDTEPHPAGHVQLQRGPDGILTANLLIQEYAAVSRRPLFRPHHQTCRAAYAAKKTPYASKKTPAEPVSDLAPSRQTCLFCGEPLAVFLLTIGFAVHPACPLPQGRGPLVAGEITKLSQRQLSRAVTSGSAVRPRRSATGEVA